MSAGNDIVCDYFISCIQQSVDARMEQDCEDTVVKLVEKRPPNQVIAREKPVTGKLSVPGGRHV